MYYQEYSVRVARRGDLEAICGAAPTNTSGRYWNLGLGEYEMSAQRQRARRWGRLLQDNIYLVLHAYLVETGTDEVTRLLCRDHLLLLQCISESFTGGAFDESEKC